MVRQTAVGTSFILTLLLIVAFGAWASRPAAQVEDTTLAGCLQPGANAGEFTLIADDKQTYQAQPTKGVELGAHANQRVELTGSVENSEGISVITVKAAKMLASSCGP